jgi:hypothetical protein
LASAYEKAGQIRRAAAGFTVAHLLAPRDARWIRPSVASLAEVVSLLQSLKMRNGTWTMEIARRARLENLGDIDALESFGRSLRAFGAPAGGRRLQQRGGS